MSRRDWQHVLNTGDQALTWRLRTIDSASSTIDLQTFLWLDDPVGHLLHDRILAAADRGVKIRILIDDSFLAGQDQANLRFAAHPNVSYRIYNPYQRRSSGTAARALLNLGEFSRLDHRMHNKIMVADGQVAIVGGRNLADQYFGHDLEANFRDMELLVGGPVISDLEKSFDSYWNDDWSFPIEEVAHLRAREVERTAIAKSAAVLSRKYPSEPVGEQARLWSELVDTSYRARVRVIADAPPSSRPESNSDRPDLVARNLKQLIQGARSDVLIVSAYLIPTPAVTEVLRQAEQRGVEVRLLTNSINSNNHLPAYAVYRNHLEELLALGAEVYEMRVDAQSRDKYLVPPTDGKDLGLHAKYMIVDGVRVFVGSANFDPRSLRINTEVGLVLENRELAQRLLLESQTDLEEQNAWRVDLDEQGLIWSSQSQNRRTPPARSSFQRVEAWFFAHLPIEAEM
ncbi:MAG: phospholipase D family protein [Dinoroseobacter sp.]|nr:phospholipase D family protein [Dinoroseobacter sp.]